jgi:hypothetical protein
MVNRPRPSTYKQEITYVNVMGWIQTSSWVEEICVCGNQRRVRVLDMKTTISGGARSLPLTGAIGGDTLMKISKYLETHG